MNSAPLSVCCLRLLTPESPKNCLSWLNQSEFPTILQCSADSPSSAVAALTEALGAEIVFEATSAAVASWSATASAGSYLLLPQAAPETPEEYSLLLELAQSSGGGRVALWLDCPGPHRANPQAVPHALPITELSFEEATELFSFVRAAMPLNFLKQAEEQHVNVELIGVTTNALEKTLVQQHSPADEFGVRALVSREPLAMLSVEPLKEVNSRLLLGQILTGLAESGMEVQFLASSVADATCTFGIEMPSIERTKELLAPFEDSINFSYAETTYAVIGVVGTHMRNRAGVSGRVFTTLAKNGISVVAIAQSTSELAISLVIKAEDSQKALCALHDALFLGTRNRIHVLLLGPGSIGSEVHTQIELHAQRTPKPRSSLSVVGVANRRASVIDAEGIAACRWQEALNTHAKPKSTEEVIDEFLALNLSNCVVVDATASDDVPSLYPKLLQHSVSIVTPNKRGLCAPYDIYLELQHLARRHNAKWYYETTVGAGLPVIGTLHDLLASGDSIVSIEAVLSGTLSYLWNTYDGASSFARLVQQAQHAGITEPDPRDDLNGFDVARKLLILARECGYPLEFDDIRVVPSIPSECLTTASVTAFYDTLAASEPEIFSQFETALRNGKALRYIARLDTSGAAVSLQAVDSEHPFYRLSGTDNILSITTERYRTQPMVIRGPGAGISVTAAGVLADVLRVATYLE